MRRMIKIVKGKKIIVNIPDWSDGAVGGDTVGTGSSPCITPFVTTQPSNVTVPTGSTTAFTVVAGPAGPFDNLLYQWYFGITPLTDGAHYTGSISSTLTVYNVDVSNEGSYYVSITNPCGNVTSSLATLTAGSGSSWDFTDLNWEVASNNWEVGY